MRAVATRIGASNALGAFGFRPALRRHCRIHVRVQSADTVTERVVKRRSHGCSIRAIRVRSPKELPMRTCTPNSPRRLRASSLAIALALVLPGPVLADAVTDWNTTANAVIGAAGGAPQQFRVLAMTHIAVHDALNAIAPHFRPYPTIAAGDPDASTGAAVARAAHDVLATTLPTQVATLDTALADYLAALPACPAAHPQCIADGQAVGAAAASAILALRTGDGSDTPHAPYTLAPGPGVYQPTDPLPPPPAPYPQFGNWGNVTPFALGSNMQFTPGNTAFLNLAGATYARDYNEVKAVGSALVRNAAPDSEESQLARFMAGGGGNVNVPARSIATDAGLDLWENGRLFALLNMAISDALVATFHVKYEHDFWRPVTAIHWLDDGNPDTAPDPTWTSYIATPPYPDYTCGLPSVVGSGTEVLRDVLGTDSVAFSYTVATLPPAVTRSYTSLEQLATDAASARVYAGIHFRSGCEQAVKLGEKVGRFVVQTQLKAL